MITVDSLDEMLQRSSMMLRSAGLDNSDIHSTDFSLTYNIRDVVDGVYVLRPIVTLKKDRVRMQALLNTSKEIPLEIYGGDAVLERDPLNGNLLITPRTEQTVFARPIVHTTLRANNVTVSAPDIEVGISTKHVPPGELNVFSAGGGACVGQATIAGNIRFDLQVRASVMGTVMPKTLTRREVHWQEGRYFAYHPQVGFMSLSYNPERLSRSVIETRNPEYVATRRDFFPAETRNALFFICDFVDIGIKAFTKMPMRQTLPEAMWPPFANRPLQIDEPVDLYDTSDPERLILHLERQEM